MGLPALPDRHRARSDHRQRHDADGRRGRTRQAVGEAGAQGTDRIAEVAPDAAVADGRAAPGGRRDIRDRRREVGVEQRHAEPRHPGRHRPPPRAAARDRHRRARPADPHAPQFGQSRTGALTAPRGGVAHPMMAAWRPGEGRSGHAEDRQLGDRSGDGRVSGLCSRRDWAGFSQASAVAATAGCPSGRAAGPGGGDGGLHQVASPGPGCARARP